MRFNSIRKELISRYILFSCEGPDEGVVIEKLYESDALVIPKPHIVDDPMTFKPFTRLRKSRDIEQRFFRESYEGNGASGLLIARIVDSRSVKFTLSKQARDSCLVESFFTRPEIEMLVIHAEDAYGAWLKSSRRNRQLRPSEFCKGELKLHKVKETSFLEEYWNGDKLVKAIRQYDRCRSQRNDEFSLGMLLA